MVQDISRDLWRVARELKKSQRLDSIFHRGLLNEIVFAAIDLCDRNELLPD